MKVAVIAALACLAVAVAAPNKSNRVKRQAWSFPDGVEIIVGNYQQTFTCPQANHAGYYADVANDCKIFHVCNPITHADGSSETQHFSFFCGNQTIFNQFSLTCTTYEEAIPCAQAPDFYFLNERIGNPTAYIHEDADVERANQVISTAYGSRIARPGK